MQDDTFALCKDTIQAWVPEKIQQVPPEIQPYWMFRDELIIEDRLVLKNTRIIIPTSERNDLLRQIHHGHLGTIKCQLHAKETVYWPGITKGIEDMVQNCETCLKFSANNHKPKPENTPRHEVPAIPWTKLATDISTFDNENYLLVVDYTSKFPIICKLPSITARVVMEIIKSIISEEGHPATIVSDNGPCYASEYFKQEMQKNGIQHITTSPHYPQSNGFVEVYVKICKGILQKAKDAGEDPHLAMMVYCNTPLGPNQKSPIKILHGKKACSDLPMANVALQAKHLVEETLISAQNQHKADENQLIEGQTAMYKTLPEKIWGKPQL